MTQPFLKFLIDGRTMKSTFFNLFLALGAIVAFSAVKAQGQVIPVIEPQANYFDQDVSEGAGSSHALVGHSSASCSSCSDYPGGSCQSGDCGRRKLLNGRFLSRIQPSETCFDDFISPITNPIYFEDPRNLTELRPLFINHKIPGDLGGGTVNVYAMQARARLTENVSFIAIKDGYISSTSEVIGDGWADIGAGLKFNLFRDVASQRLWSAGVTYEAPTGSSAAQQGNGSGDVNLFSSGAARLGERSFFMAAGGIRAPLNASRGSTSMYNSFHYSYKTSQKLYALTELNWFRWIGSGDEFALPVEGVDLANFGAIGVTGNNIVTWAYGLKLKPNRNHELGCAYEIPVSGRRDIFGPRVTVDYIRRF